jgi:hypothetical protein
MRRSIPVMRTSLQTRAAANAAPASNLTGRQDCRRDRDDGPRAKRHHGEKCYRYARGQQRNRHDTRDEHAGPRGDRFYRGIGTQSPGSGLGLSIVQRIAQYFGGRGLGIVIARPSAESVRVDGAHALTDETDEKDEPDARPHA